MIYLEAMERGAVEWGRLRRPWGAGAKRQGNRTPGDPRVPTLPPCHPRPYEANPLPCSFHKIPTLERMASPAPLPSHGDCQTSGSHEKEAAEKCKVHRHNRCVAARMAGNLPGPGMRESR